MDEKIVKKLITDGIGGILGSWKANINSKKFYAYCIGMAALLVAGFTKLIPTDDFSGIFKVLNIGYWGAQGGIDAIKALGNVMEKRNGKTEEVSPP